MKIHDDPQKMLIELREQCVSNPERVAHMNKSRLTQLNRVFYKNFQPTAFIHSLKAKAEPILSGASEELPVLAKVPITDIILYVYQRLKETSGEKTVAEKRQAFELMVKMLGKGDLALMPSCVCVTSKGDGSDAKYVPTFGELVIQEMVSIQDEEASNTNESAIQTLVSKLDYIDPQHGSGSAPLAIMAIENRGGQLPDVEFSDSVLKQAVQYLLETKGLSLIQNTEMAYNLFESAVTKRVALDKVMIRDGLSLADMYRATGNNELADSLQGHINHQTALNIIDSQADRISNDYDPSVYFDM